MHILDFFWFALLGCAYGVAGKSFVKVKYLYMYNHLDIAIATLYDY